MARVRRGTAAVPTDVYILAVETTADLAGFRPLDLGQLSLLGDFPSLPPIRYPGPPLQSLSATRRSPDTVTTPVTGVIA